LLLKSLGPGVITGAADDDPSGIATYSVAGAQLGTKLLWTALLTWPLMAAVQMMCARIGMVTGQRLAGNFKQRFPSWLLRVFIVALLAANTINIAADLAGMADAAEMLSGINAHWFVVVFALLISWATVRLRYHQIANVLKWLVVVLFAYPITAFVVGADWGRVMADMLLLMEDLGIPGIDVLRTRLMFVNVIWKHLPACVLPKSLCSKKQPNPGVLLCIIGSSFTPHPGGSHGGQRIKRTICR
jgi:NRAMP (natural resistance-associated macrophage protein)-like metal ion transporter